MLSTGVLIMIKKGKADGQKAPYRKTRGLGLREETGQVAMK